MVKKTASMKVKRYKTSTKKNIAAAYGVQDYHTITNRIARNLHKLSTDELKTLGDYGGPGKLFPAQMEIIIRLLGTPEKPKMLYEEEAA